LPGPGSAADPNGPGSAADRERARIAGELHDDTLQALTAAGMRLDSLARRLDRGETTGAGDAAREVRHTVLFIGKFNRSGCRNAKLPGGSGAATVSQARTLELGAGII